MDDTVASQMVVAAVLIWASIVSQELSFFGFPNQDSVDVEVERQLEKIDRT